MGELTDAAKAEIREAIRIVKEDRTDAFIRGRVTAYTTAAKPEPAVEDEVIRPSRETPPPPPPKEVKPKEEPAKRRDAWWGDVFDE